MGFRLKETPPQSQVEIIRKAHLVASALAVITLHTGIGVMGTAGLKVII